MKKVISLFIAVILTFCLYAQPAYESCPCTNLFQELIRKVEKNYAGYVHKVREHNDSSSYVQLKKKLSQEALATTHQDCYYVLTKFINYFNDGHLFVIELPDNTPHQSDSLRKLIQQVTLTEKQVRKLQLQNKINPISGIWKDKNQRLAIQQISKTKYIGVTIENLNDRWTRGMVKMEIDRTGNNEYFITIYRNDFSPIRFSKVQIYKNCMLPFGVYRFVKESPLEPELKYVNTADP